MALFAESEDKIYGDIINDLVNSTNITRSSPGSKMRSLIEACSKKLGKMYSVFDLNFGQAFLNGAEGKWLSYLGDMMGVPRLGETAAVVTALDKNIKFTVDIGTFGSINGGGSITLARGTIISTGAGSTGIKYRVVINTVLDSAADEAFVSVQALRTGSSQNVGKGQLRYHNFTAYTDSVNSSLKVTNIADIVTGADLESATNYRYRIANQVLSSEKANQTAIRLAALAVPGVADITILSYHRGIGSFDLLITSITPSVSDGLITAVEAAVGQVTSEGINVKVRGPIELGLSLIGTLEYRRALTEQEESEILLNVTQNVTDSINSLDIAEEYVVQEILEIALSTSSLIKKLGVTSKPLDNMYIYRPSKLEDNKVRSILIDDFIPESDERIIVENVYGGSTPILFRSA